MSQLSRLPDMRARDIRRRVEVIQKKLSDLQELDIPCAFCYSSVRNTGSLFTLGDRRITDVMERHKNEILRNLIESKPESVSERRQEIRLILPPLPGPLSELSRGTMQSLIVGILKDLGIRWSDPKPQWWPMDIPFFSPRSIPDSFKGNWTQSLRRVLESVYSFFSYDVNTYIAGNLEVYEGDDEREDQTTPDGDKEAEKGGEEERDDGNKAEEKRDRDTEEGTEKDEDDEETDDAMSGAGYDTSTEEDAFEDSQSPEITSEHLKPDASYSSHKAHTDLGKIEGLHNESSAANNHRVCSNSSSSSSQKPGSPSADVSQTLSSSSSNKTISSFTVENILMGSTSRSNSTSSGSPTSAPHASTISFLPFSATNSATNANGSTPISPASANWTSHPPVKYTKFTMVSPLSMKRGVDKRRKSERDKTVTTTCMDTSYHPRVQVSAPSNVEGAGHQVAKLKEEPKSPITPSVSIHPPSGSTPSSATSSSQHSHSTYHHSVIQTAVPSSALPLSRQSSSQSVVASPRLVPVSPSPFPHIQTQSPQQQQQQYVVFFPPNVALMTAPTADLQVLGQTATSAAQLYVQGMPTVLQQPPNGTHKHKGSPHLSSSSPSPPPNHSGMTGSALSSNNLRMFRTSSNPSFGSSSKITDAHFHSIAAACVDKSQTLARKIGSKSLQTTGDRGVSGGKGAPKQKKLRFHMTTVVKKVRRRSSSVSLTAPPPTLCNRAPPDARHKEPDAIPPDSNGGNKTQPTTDTTTAKSTTAAEESHAATDPSTISNNSTSSDSKTTTRPLHSSFDSQTTANSPPTSQAPPSSSASSAHTYASKFDNLPLPCATSSGIESMTAESEQQASNGRGRGRGRGKRARGYTRRKRELTFHLYEDPYRAKRTRHQK